MKRRNVLKTIAVLVAGLATTAWIGNAVAAGAPFSASYVMTYVEKDGDLNIWSGQGSGTLLGDTSAGAAVKVMGKKGEGVFTITTSSGDSLVLTFAQTWDEVSQTWLGSFTVTDGTGRFAEATGSGTIIAQANADGNMAATLEGTVSF